MTSQLHELPHDQRDEIHKQRLAIVAAMPDATRTELGKAMGLSPAGVGHWARQRKVKLPGATLAERRTKVIVEAIRDGKTRVQIAETLGITRAALNGWAAAHKVPLPDDRTLTRHRPMCTRCERRQAVRSTNADKPAQHGLCVACRRDDLGTTCTWRACTRPGKWGRAVHNPPRHGGRTPEGARRGVRTLEPAPADVRSP